MNIEYTKIGDYLLPNLVIKNKNYEQINKYGYLKLNYIKEHKKRLYQTLLMKNELTNHLFSVSKDCENRYNILMNKKEEYLKRLPGFNCGGCGYGSCEGMAEAMCKSIENYKKCKPLKGEKLKEMEEYLDGRNH